MKKLGLLLCLCGLSLSAQQEEIKFNQKLSYEIKKNSKEKGIMDFYLSNSEYTLFSLSELEGDSYFGLYDGKTSMKVSIDPFTKQAKVGTYNYYYGEIDTEKKYIRTDEKGNYNGRSCIIYKERDEKFCIDENSQYNNAWIIHKELKGEIIYSEGDRVKVSLAEKTPVNYSIKVDKNEIAKYYAEMQKQDSINSTYAVDSAVAVVDSVAIATIVEDPFEYHYISKAYQKYFEEGDNVSFYVSKILSSVPYYNYGDKEERKKAITYLKNAYKSQIKNLYKAKYITKEEQKKLQKFFTEYITEVENYVPKPVPQNAIDTVTHTTEDYDYFTPYQSVYKNEVIEKNPPLALNEVLNNEKLVKNMPQFCQNLGEKLPKFENEKLGIHLNNYLGQLCDLYLYQNGGSVGYFETINSMRKSLLEIELMQSTLSQKDKTQLIEIIKNLD